MGPVEKLGNQEKTILLERYRVAQRAISKKLLSARNEDEVCRILAKILSEETDALAVDVLVPEGELLIRRSLMGPLSSIILSLPNPPVFPPRGGDLFLSTRVWDTKKPIIIKNPASDLDLPEFYRTPPFKEIGLVVGFFLNDHAHNEALMGVVVLFNQNPDAFDDPLIVDLVSDIVDSASIALDRLKTEARLAVMTRLYESLAAINALVLRKTEEEVLLSETVRVLIENSGFIAAGFYFPDDRRKLLKLRTYRIKDPSGLTSRHPQSFSLDPDSPDARRSPVKAFATETLIIENDLVNACREAGFAKLGDDYDALSFRSSGIFPLFRSGECIGVFAVTSSEVNFFTPDTLRLLSEIAKILSMTLDGIESERIRQESEERLNTLIETLPEAIFFKDGGGRWKIVNPSGLRLFKLEGRTDWVNKTDLELGALHPDFVSAYEACALSDNVAWMKREPSNGIEILVDVEGNPVIMDVTKVPLFNPDGTQKGLVVSAQDISERKRNESRIEHLATHDDLTNLPNRRVFLDRIAQILLRSERTGECFAVGLLDLDGFKEVNDRLGHPKGDELLIQVGKRLRDLLRKTDTLVRMGGDEFGLLLTDLEGKASCQDLFKKIVDSLLDPFFLDGDAVTPVRISGSLGLSLSPPDHGEVTVLIAHSDMALYQVKGRGGNGWAVFERAMEDSLLEQHRIRTEFERALGNGELCLYYQPQVNMETGQVVGVEALIRWNHPAHGFLTPDNFIGVVEKSDLIFPLGRWVLSTVLLQQDQWSREGLNLSVSVNIGARHFLSDGFFDTLSELLSKAERSVRPAIKIEVTETEALRDLDKARRVIELCWTLGVSVSLDDFGTGQASLTSLQQLDIKEVKIDIGFVRRMMESPKDLVIVSILSSAARMMLIGVVAEGVETEEAGKILVQMGCLIGQGYAIAEAMASSLIPIWVKEWRPFESWKRQIL